MSSGLFAQMAVLEGYAFEEDNRGFLNLVQVNIKNINTGETITVHSNREGYFTANLGINSEYELVGTKDLFYPNTATLSTNGKSDGEKVFVKFKMEREPGYIFDVTIAPKRVSDTVEVDAIKGATIEVYNNTTKKEELIIKENVNPNFNLTLKKGSHYTVLIRKEGYMTKRLEAYVNINGCILCFDGVGNIRPAITDNLTEGNEMGTLLANIELDPVSVGTSFELRNIYYSYNKSDIRPDAAQELDKLIITLRDNPGIVIELGAHTDSRGDEAYNLNLSTERAKSAVDYLVAIGGIDAKRVFYKGYGESELLNKCNSTADCTEDQHAVNRRTELKVLEIKPYVQSELKSLATLKEEEEFQRLLEEIQNQDQVQVGEGETAPEDAPKKLYKEGEPIIEEEPSIEVEQQNKAASIIEEKITEAPALIEQIIEEPVLEKVEEQPTLEKVVDTPVVEKVMEVEKTTTVDQKVAQETVNTSSKIAEASDKADAMINGGSAGFIPTEDAIIGPVKLIPAGYNGYKIQIGAFSKPLQANSPVLVRHGNIYVDRNTKGNFNYMIGDFDSRESADGFLKDIISKQYPDAIIVTYKDGVK